MQADGYHNGKLSGEKILGYWVTEEFADNDRD